MTRLFFLLPLFLLSIWANFSSKKMDNTEMTLCISQPADSYKSTDENLANDLNPFHNDTTKNYSMPLLSQTPKGDLMLSWTERDTQGITALCIAFSKDNGKTFSEKKTVYAGTGVSNSRMMRAKVLAKKDGSFVAVFSNRGESAPNQGGRGGGRSSNIVFCMSKDGGSTWTSPASVDSDPKQGIVRGFFDAVLMANDEVAVAYLKDVENIPNVKKEIYAL